MIGRRREKRRQMEQSQLLREQQRFAASPEAAEYNKLAAQAKQFGVDTSKMGKFGFGNSGNAQIVSQMRDQINQRSIGQSGGNRPTMTFGDAAPAALQATNPKPMPIPPSFRPLMPGAQPQPGQPQPGQPQPGQPQPGQPQTKGYTPPPSNALTASNQQQPNAQFQALRSQFTQQQPAQQQPAQQQPAQQQAMSEEEKKRLGQM